MGNTSRTRLLALAVGISLISVMEGLFGQGSVCDARLEKLAVGPHGYRERGNRCEGIYAKQVSGTMLFVASLTEYVEPYDSTAPGEIAIVGSCLSAVAPRLRARATKYDVYYQMDAHPTPKDRTFHWPTHILVAQQIRPSELGVIGWVRYSIGDITRDVLVPLRVLQDTSGASAIERPIALNVMLFPTARFDSVYVTLALLGSHGHPERHLERNRELDQGYYPAEFPIRYQISEQLRGGIYYLEFRAKLPDGGFIAPLRHWFCVAPDQTTQTTPVGPDTTTASSAGSRCARGFGDDGTQHGETSLFCPSDT